MSVKPILFSSLFVLAGAAHADFNWQVDANLGNSAIEFDEDDAIGSDGGDIEREGFGIAGRYYLQSVAMESFPYREAAFLGKQSYLSVDYSEDEITKPSRSDDKDENLNLAANIRIGETAFRVGGVLGTHDNDEYSGNVFGVGFGWHIMDVSLLSFETLFESGDANRVDTDIQQFSVGYKPILPLGDTHLAVEGSADLINEVNELGSVEDETGTANFNVSAIWYMTQKFGFGARITTTAIDYDYDDDPTLSSSEPDTTVTRLISGLISYEFTENVGIDASLGFGAGSTEYKDPIFGSARDDDDFGLFNLDIGIQGRF